MAIPARSNNDALLAIGASLFKPDDTRKHRLDVISELRHATEQLLNPMIPVATNIVKPEGVA
jgi:hypothetical protein